MRRLPFVFLFLAPLGGCGVAKHMQPEVSIQSKATSRRCVRTLDSSTTSHAQGGVTVSLDDYPAATRFSDDWIGVEWLVVNRDLYALIRNRTRGEMRIGGTVAGPERQRTAIPQTVLGGHSSRDIRLGRLAGPEGVEMKELELSIRVANEECTYRFQLAPVR